MSHTVTIRTATVTSGGTSSVFVNTGYLKTYRGILKVLELLLGIVCVGIIANNIDGGWQYTVHKQFFLVITTTFMIGTFILVLSCLSSMSTDSIISKTIYEIIYHAIAFGLLLAASLTLLITVNNNNKYNRDYELLLGAAICGLVNTALYFISTLLALRSYRGL